MNINSIKFIQQNIINQRNTNSIMFCGVKKCTDTFERRNKPEELKITNPYSNEKLDLPKIDLSKSQDIILTNNKRVAMILDYNPYRTEIIYDKEKRENIEAVILLSESRTECDEFACNILSKDLKTEYGQILYSKRHRGCNKGIEEVFIKTTDKNIEGLNKIADKYAVQYCKDNKLPLNITMYPEPKDYRANFNEGKRFVIPEKGSCEYNFLMENYGTPNPNKALKELLLQSKQTGQKINLEDWNNYEFKMYLPKHLVDKYKNELELYTDTHH